MNTVINIKEQLFIDKPFINEMIDEAIGLIEHSQLRATAKHVFKAGGKRIRPALMAATYKALGGHDRTAVIKIGVALELIHNWSLVHDDIIDKSDIRRGLPTIHNQWDETVAILSGDMLNNLAYQMIACAPIEATKIKEVLAIISNATMELIDGELMDIHFEKQNEVNESDYLEMIQKKTGALFSAATKIGALLHTNDEVICAAMENYGSKIGLAFQIQDDLLDLIGDKDAFGKEIGKDIKEGKKTLMALHTLNHADKSDASRFKVILEATSNSNDEVEEAINVIERTGGLSYARSYIDSLLESALQSLEVIPFSDEKTVLVELAKFIGSRNY